MIRQLSSGVIWLAMVALFAIPAIPAEAQEAGGRMRVFVPDIKPTEGLNRRFGERAAEELRKRIDGLGTHAPVDDRTVRDALRQYRLDMRELSCAEARQLAVQINADLVMCGEYAQDGDQYVVNASFISAETGESYDIEGLRVDPRNEREAGVRIFEQFETMVEQTAQAYYCQQDFQSQNWESAYTRCNNAVQLNPEMISVRIARGHVLRERGEMEQALADFEFVLEQEPQHESALQNAGYIAAQLGQHEAAREYYTEYLRLNPTNTAVRMREAYELAQAGDAYGALGLVEEGLEHEPDNPELYRQIGNFAFAAASEERQRTQGDNGNQLSPEVRELYTRAVNAYEQIFGMEEAEVQAREFRNTAAAYIQLGDLDGAVAVSERALEAYPEEPVIWSVYADALQRQGQIEEAIQALEEVKRIDPEYANVAARQGRWLLDTGQEDRAMAMFRESIQRGEQTPDAIANMLFAEGYQNGYENQDYPHAIRFFEAAKQFEVSPRMKSQLDFWHGVSLYNRATALQAPGTVEAARQTLPMFQQALRLFESGRAYVATTTINLQQFIDGANTYVEIQEAIIARAGRR